MKQSHRLLWIAKNCDWSRKDHATVKLDSSVASRGMKTYGEERIELQNLQWAEELGCCLKNCRSWKIRSINLRLRSTWRPLDSSFERKGSLVTVEICVRCGRWFSNQFEKVSYTPLSCNTVGRELYSQLVSCTLVAVVPWNGLGHSHRKARLHVRVYFKLIWF